PFCMEAIEYVVSCRLPFWPYNGQVQRRNSWPPAMRASQNVAQRCVRCNGCYTAYHPADQHPLRNTTRFFKLLRCETRHRLSFVLGYRQPGRFLLYSFDVGSGREVGPNQMQGRWRLPRYNGQVQRRISWTPAMRTRAETSPSVASAATVVIPRATRRTTTNYETQPTSSSRFVAKHATAFPLSLATRKPSFLWANHAPLTAGARPAQTRSRRAGLSAV